MKRLGLLGVMLTTCLLGGLCELRAQDTIRMTGVKTLCLTWSTIGNYARVLIVEFGDGRQETIENGTKYEFFNADISLYSPTSFLSLTTHGWSSSSSEAKPYSKFSSLDVSGCSALEELDCSFNGLKSLDVSGCSALKELDCSSNGLTTLDVSNNPALKELRCNYNALTTLDVSHNPALSGLGCAQNALTSLDVSHNPALSGLGCAQNALTSLDVSHNPALSGLGCAQNALTSLDVSHNPHLYSLYCDRNDLTSLDVSKNKELRILSCEYCNLTNLEWDEYVGNGPFRLYMQGNRRSILDAKSNRFDLNSLPGFDLERAYDWDGGEVVDGHYLEYYDVPEMVVTYKYKVSNQVTEGVSFSLRRKSDNTDLSCMAYLERLGAGMSINSRFMRDSIIVPYVCDSVRIDEARVHEYSQILSGLGKHHLVVGENRIKIVVMAEDSSLQTHIVQILRTSTNTNLKSLTVSAGTLEPAFHPEVFSYRLEVPYETDRLKVEAEGPWMLDNLVRVLGTGEKSLMEGYNHIQVVVDRNSIISLSPMPLQIYTLEVTRRSRALSSDAALQSLTVDAGTLEPAFSPDTYDYHVKVPYATSSLGVEAVARHDSATVLGTGKYNLNVGDNPIRIVVTAEDGSQQTYTLTVTRIDAALQSLTVSAGTLKPAFSSEVYDYDVTVSYETDGIEVFAEARDESATVSGVGKYDLQVGDNRIEIVVTAEAVSQQVYTLTVTRKRFISSDAALQSLTVSAGTLEPAFSSEVYKYNVEVSYETDSLEVFAAARDENATVSGAGEYDLEVGDNDIEIVVTAEDGTQQTYTLTVRRKARILSSDAALLSLTVSVGTLEPAFSPDHYYYIVEVSYEIDSLEVGAVARHDSAMVSGTGKYGLQVGEKDIKIVVTAENGSREAYWLKVMRRERVLSSDATLRVLSVSVGTLRPAFYPTIFNYRVEVPNDVKSMEVVAEPNDDSAKVSYVKRLSLAVGDNKNEIVVRAEDYTQQIYTLVVHRQKPKDPTAVESESGLSDVRVYAQDGAIHLSKSIGELAVYTASGLCVYSGHAVVIPAPQPGLYIVHRVADGYSWKVVVK